MKKKYISFILSGALLCSTFLFLQINAAESSNSLIVTTSAQKTEMVLDENFNDFDSNVATKVPMDGSNNSVWTPIFSGGLITISDRNENDKMVTLTRAGTTTTGITMTCQLQQALELNSVPVDQVCVIEQELITSSGNFLDGEGVITGEKSSNGAQIKFKNSADSPAVFASLGSPQEGIMFNGETVRAYESGVSYNLKFIIDPANYKMYFYINDEEMGERDFTYSDLTHIQYAQAGRTQGEYSIDNIKVYLEEKESILPSVTDVSISGEPKIGQRLTVDYQFAGGNGTDACIYQWKSADAIDGEYIDIANAVTKTFALTKEYVGKYIQCVVTARDNSGVQGNTVKSVPVGPIEMTETTLKIKKSFVDENFNHENGYTDTDQVTWSLIQVAGTVTFPNKIEGSSDDKVMKLERTSAKNSVTTTLAFTNPAWMKDAEYQPGDVFVIEQDLTIDSTISGGAVIRFRNTSNFFMTFKTGPENESGTVVSGVNPGFNFSAGKVYDQVVDSYTVGQTYNLKFVIDPEADTLELWVDGVPVDNRLFGSSEITHIQYLHDVIGLGSFSIDNVKVYLAETEFVLEPSTQVTDITLTDAEGAPMTELIGGTQINANVTVKAVDKKATVFAALYDSKGALAAIEPLTLVFDQESETASGNIALSLPQDVSGYCYRLFALDSAMTMRPISFAKEIAYLNTTGIIGK